MFIEKKIFQVKFDDDIYHVSVSFYGNKKSSKVIAFSQGYCYDSILYQELFRKLGEDHLIIAPEINGMRIKGEKGIFDNSKFNNCRLLFKKTISEVLKNKEVFCVMGQSMGGNVCLSVDSKKVVLINPQMPTRKNIFIFLSRGIPTLAKEMSTKKSGKFRIKVVYDYFVNFTANLKNNFIYLNSVRKQKFEDIYDKTDREVLLINSSRKDFDGFFNYDKKRFKKHYKNLTLVDLHGTHSKVLYDHKGFAEGIAEFLKN